MLESTPFAVLIGTVLGFLSGLGIGGGSLLILWLTIVLDMEQSIARGINLLFFLPSAVIACFFRFRQGVVKWSHILPAILAGCTTALFFSWIGIGMDMVLLRKLFGGLLILTGLRELCYRPKTRK